MKKRLVRLVVVAAALVPVGLFAGACSERFGASDCRSIRTCPVPVAGAAGESGDPASGAGIGGMTDDLRDGSAGETVGVGGAAFPLGTAGEGGADESGAGRFRGCDGTPFLGSDAILRSCIFRVGCQPWTFPTDTISRCLSENTQLSRAYQNCSMNAASCADVAACEGSHIETAFCAGKSDGTYCNGSEIAYCNAYPYAHDCAKDGGTCKDFGTEIDSFGTRVACVLPGIASCTETSQTPRCGGADDAYSYRCHDLLAYGTKCTRLGGECNDAGVCETPIDCDSPGVVCEQDSASVCDGHSRAVYDCGSVGLRCDTTKSYIADEAHHCLAPGCTREDLEACHESCAGTTLTVCYGGSPVSVNCRDYGFKKCVEYDYSCSANATGNCVDPSQTVSYAQCE